MTAHRLAAFAALLVSALLWSVPANAQAYVPGVTCSGGQAMTGYTPQSGIACGMPVIRSYLAGLTLSNDGASPNTVLDIAVGVAADSTDADMIALASAFTKSTGGAWVAGSGNNGMGAGLTVAASTWYHVFLIVKGGAAEIYFDTSASAANAPSGTTYFRRIGSFRTDSSSHILAFKQNGDEFLWSATFGDANGVTVPTTAATQTLTVPTGVEVWAKFRAALVGSVLGEINFYPLDQSTQSPTVPAGNSNIGFNASGAQQAYGDFTIRTNTSAQIGVVGNSASLSYYNTTYGWIDRRGRDN